MSKGPRRPTDQDHALRGAINTLVAQANDGDAISGDDATALLDTHFPDDQAYDSDADAIDILCAVLQHFELHDACRRAFSLRIGGPLPDLTIVIPNYNNSRFIDTCLNTINDQTLRDLVVVFVDDASTDDSAERFRQFPWRDGIHPRLIRNLGNLGVAETRVSGFRQVFTDYATTLDSDDCYMSTEKLERELAAAKRAPNAIGFSLTVQIDESGARFEKQSEFEVREGDILIDLVANQFMNPRDYVMPASLYRRAGGYDPTVELYEDLDLKIRLAGLGARFVYTGVEGTGYRQRDGSLSEVSIKRQYDGRSRVLLKNMPMLLDHFDIDDLLHEMRIFVPIEGISAKAAVARRDERENKSRQQKS